LKEKKKTLLITSSTDFKHYIHKEILENQYIDAIFIFQDPETSLERRLTNNRKIKTLKNCFKEISITLIEYIGYQKMKFMEESVPIKAAHHLYCKEACIKYFSNKVIFNLFDANKPSDGQSKKAFINYCKENYQDYGGEETDLIKLVNEVNNNEFKDKNAIKWYTKNTFFYRLLNGVLRKDNICEFFEIRYAINQLAKALVNYKCNFGTNTKIYRVSRINKKELSLFQEKPVGDINIIQLIGFISTSLKKETAESFAKDCKPCNEEESVILYEIEVDKKASEKLFDIKSVSAFPQEDELLINYDNFIKINSVENSNHSDYDYIVKCTFSDFKEIEQKVDKKTQQITQHFDLKDKNYTCDDFYLAELLKNLRKDNELLKLLEKIKPEDLKEQEKSVLYYFFGVVYYYNGKYDEALKKQEDAKKKKEKTVGKNHIETALIYDAIGAVYAKQGKHQKALEHYEKVKEIREKKPNIGKEHQDTLSTYDNIGDIYMNQGNNDKALEFYLQSLTTRKKLKIENLDSATNLDRIGKIYEKQKKYDLAGKYFNEALDFRKKILGENHPDIAVSYDNIGNILLSENNQNQAKIYFDKAYEIRKDKLGEDHPDFAVSYDMIGNFHKTQKNFERAIQNYEKALNIRKIKFGEDHQDTATSFDNIGEICKIQKMFQEALKNYQKALNIRIKKFGEAHQDTAISYENVGNIYSSDGKDQESLEFLEKALEIRQKLENKIPKTRELFDDINIKRATLGAPKLEWREREKENKFKNWFFIIGFIGILIVGYLLLKIFERDQIIEKHESEKKENDNNSNKQTLFTFILTILFSYLLSWIGNLIGMFFKK